MNKYIFTFFLIFVSLTAFAGISVSEKKALISIYQSLNGKNWNTKWDLNKPETTWFGVQIVGDKVIALDLSNNNLSGTIPTEIGQLVHLQKLNLFKNQIEGQIPNVFGSMKDLKELNLAFYNLSGS